MQNITIKPLETVRLGKDFLCSLAVLFVLLLIPSLTVVAADASLLQYSVNEDDTVEITGYPLDETGELIIPATIEEKSVTSIGIRAFQSCSSLTSISIPDSVISISVFVFDSCSSLTAILVDEGNPSYASSGGVLFDKALAALIAYPEGLNGAYVIPAGVTTIENGAFRNCSGLTSVSLPDGVTSMQGEAFFNCTGLTSINIPSSMISIGERVFRACTSLASILIDEDNPSFSSSNGALFNKAMTTLFAYPAATGDYTIPAGVTIIGIQAFADCTGLTSVRIPASMTSIGLFAFFNCSNLVSIHFEGNEAPTLGASPFFRVSAEAAVTFPLGATGYSNPFGELPASVLASDWYSGAAEIQPTGWRYFDWFKGFKPEGANWIYHGRHGWLYVLGEDTSGLFLWDVELGRWMFTNDSIYPWMYAYGPSGGWVFFFEGGRPGARFFKRGDTGAVISEEGLSTNVN